MIGGQPSILKIMFYIYCRLLLITVNWYCQNTLSLWCRHLLVCLHQWSQFAVKDFKLLDTAGSSKSVEKKTGTLKFLEYSSLSSLWPFIILRTP